MSADRSSLREDGHQPCGCKQKCCDLPEEHDHPFAVCKGLPPRLIEEAERRGVVPPAPSTLAKYGLTTEAWLQLLADQGWVCPICGKDKNRWNTDHEHVAGWARMSDEDRAKHVRGVLCWYCNHRRVNSLMPSAEAQRIADYIRAYEERTGKVRP